MPTRSARRSSAQSDRFGPPAQAELFAPEPEERYVPKPEYVRSSFRSHLQKLAKARDWWQMPDDEIVSTRETRPRQLADFLPDEAEAAEWLRQVNEEVAKLDARSGPERPKDRYSLRGQFDPPWRVPDA